MRIRLRASRSVARQMTPLLWRPVVSRSRSGRADAQVVGRPAALGHTGRFVPGDKPPAAPQRDGRSVSQSDRRCPPVSPVVRRSPRYKGGKNEGIYPPLGRKTLCIQHLVGTSSGCPMRPLDLLVDPPPHPAGWPPHAARRDAQRPRKSSSPHQSPQRGGAHAERRGDLPPRHDPVQVWCGHRAPRVARVLHTPHGIASNTPSQAGRKHRNRRVYPTYNRLGKGLDDRDGGGLPSTLWPSRRRNSAR